VTLEIAVDVHRRAQMNPFHATHLRERSMQSDLMVYASSSR